VRQKECFARDESIGTFVGRLNNNNHNCYKLIKKLNFIQYSHTKIQLTKNTFLKFIKWLYHESMDIHLYLIYYLGIEQLFKCFKFGLHCFFYSLIRHLFLIRYITLMKL